MRIIVVSDTHGSIREFINEVNRMERLDLIIHLGDYVEDGLKIGEITGIKTIMVKGNGDYFQGDYKEDEIFDIEDKKVLATHGHIHRVGYDLNGLLYRAEEIGADIVLFGHTHVPVLFNERSIWVMNPGSPSMPRGFDRKKTFGIMDIKEDIKASIYEIESSF